MTSQGKESRAYGNTKEDQERAIGPIRFRSWLHFDRSNQLYEKPICRLLRNVQFVAWCFIDQLSRLAILGFIASFINNKSQLDPNQFVVNITQTPDIRETVVMHCCYGLPGFISLNSIR